MKLAAKFWMGSRISSLILVSSALLAASAYAAPVAPLLEEPFAPQAAAAPAPQPPQIEEFQSIEDRWSVALVHGDQYAMELLLSPYFVNISSTGVVDTHDQYIAFLFAKDAGRPYSLEQKVASVRVFGDTAIVSGTYLSKVTVSGVPTERSGIFTNVFVRNNAHWLCVNAQQTGVVDEPLSALKKKKEHEKKHSRAELPFHLPF